MKNNLLHKNMHAEDFHKPVPLFSSIRFNTPCFLFLEGCCVCNPCLQVRDTMSPYKESIGLPTTSIKMLVHSVVFNTLTYFHFPFYLSLSRYIVNVIYCLVNFIIYFTCV